MSDSLARRPLSSDGKVYFRVAEGATGDDVHDGSIAAQRRGRRRAASLALATAAMLALPTLTAYAADESEVRQAVAEVAPKVVAWRRHIHEHPELSNREFETAKLVAEHLTHLGLDVRTGIAHTGVVGVLEGRGAGPVIALRADMDALPVREQTGLPFASRETAMYEGREVPVMHACGHDAHTAMLMGAAEVLAGMRNAFPGTVLFVFQPAEEGTPAGEDGGARMMLVEGVFDDPVPDAILGLHVEPGPLGHIQTRPGGFLPSATSIEIALGGRQTHAARPWEGTDLINLIADIVKGITTLSARRFDVFDVPNVATIAAIDAGVRGNILPGEATLLGTLRTYSNERREEMKQHVRILVEEHAKLYGATAEIRLEDVAAVTDNDAGILELILPALEAAAGEAGVDDNASLRGAAEDFSFFQEQIPGVYYIIGATKNYAERAPVPSNHSPAFDIDEEVMETGVTAHVLTALRFLRNFDRGK